MKRQRLRDHLFDQQKGRCFYCRRHMLPAGADDDRAATLDHVAAASRDGPTHISNAVAACRRCNEAKADKALKQFLKELRPGRPLHKRVTPARDAEIAERRAARKMRERRNLGRASA